MERNWEPTLDDSDAMELGRALTELEKTGRPFQLGFDGDEWTLTMGTVERSNDTAIGVIVDALLLTR